MSSKDDGVVVEHSTDAQGFPSVSMKLDGEAGAISVDTFLQVFTYAHQILRELDMVISADKRGTIEWYVEDLRIGSLAATVRCRPQRKKSARLAPEIARTFVEGLKAIEHSPTVPQGFAEPSVKKVRRLSAKLVGTSKTFHVSTGDKTQAVEATVTTKAAGNAANALTERSTSVGSVLGTLEVISIHGGSVFNIYDEINRRAIRCSFDRQQHLDAVKAALGKRVLAIGLIRRNELGQPISVLIEDLELLPEEHELPKVADIKGSDPEFTARLSTDEYLKVLREG